MAQQEVAPAAASRKSRSSSGAAAAKKSGKKKKNQPGKYSQLVVDAIRKLNERNGSSLAKIYSEAKKVGWFDQQNGRTYLKYSIKALVQNDTLLQVKGVGANGSFRLNKKKLEGLAVAKKSPAAAPKPAAKKAAASSAPKKSPKKAKPAAKKASAKPAAKSPKKAKPAAKKKVVKKAAKPKALKAKKA